MDRSIRSNSPWEYIDFELEIRKGTRRKYTVCVRSPEGETQEEMRFPFDTGELKDKLKDLETAVLLSGRKRRRVHTPEEQAVQSFGQKLFQAIMGGEIRAHYDLSLRQARRQNKGLRLKLRIQPPELAVLPWEFLYDPGRNSYLCLSCKTPLVRYLELREPVEQLAVSPPLKILGMVAGPSDLAPLDVEHEKRRIEKAIKDLQTQGRVELTWLEGQTARDLQRAMIHGPWHVFHFIGHGGIDPETQEGLIALANDEGYARFLPAEDLALLLRDHWDLRLVVLNSCEGARGNAQDAFSSTAATLVRPGIPAVLANQYEITDEAAIAFSRTFYQAVADGLPVDAAVAYARTSLKIEIDNTLEWATPVLYMRSPDGRIFDISPDVQPVKHAQEEPEDQGEEIPLRMYRKAVERAWVSEELTRREVERLRHLANNTLGLSLSAAADIEHEVMGDTKEAILEPQIRNPEEGGRRDLLDELYAQARRSHQDQEWQAVIDLFEEIHALDPAYPDPERLLASAREALADVEQARRAATVYEQGLRRMEAKEWAQALESFEEVQQLRPGYQDTERLLSQARQEEERRKRLDELEAEAHRLHRDRQWQEVVETFDQIHALDPQHSDPEGLEASAREALERAQKEQDALKQYRESVESAWAEEELEKGEAEQLRALKDRLGLSPTTAADVERQVMGDTIEAILKRQEKAAREQYRKAVEEAWADKELSRAEAEQLEVLASELGLGRETAANIERAVIGDTTQAILEHQRKEEEERSRYLGELYAQARQLHRAQDWEAVVRTFEQINAEDPTYPDSEGLLAVARESLERARRAATVYEQGLRRMEAKEWAQALESFEEVQQLRPGYQDTERLLSQARQEEERRKRLDELEAEAHRLHRGRDWQEVVETFDQIHALDPEHPDPEGLLKSAREALERAQKEQDALHRYRESVESAWAEEELDRGEAERLRKLKNRLELSPSAAVDIEREVMGDTLEATVEHQERAAREEKRRNRLEELYAQARQRHRDQEWQAVVEVFDQIYTLDSNYSDPERLLAAAHEQLAAREELAQRVAALYDQGRRHIEGEEWSQALECFKEVQRLEPGYRDTEVLLSQAQDELAKPQTVEVPDLSGQNALQMRSILEDRGLKLGTQSKVSSDTVPEGEFIKQTPEAGTEVEASSSVDITVSSGPSALEVPDLAGQSRSEARSTLAAAGLKLGSQSKAPNDSVPEGGIVKQNPAAGAKAKQGRSIAITLSSGRQEKATTAVPDVSGKELEEAQQVLSSVGLVFEGSRTQGSSKRAGTVVSTDPPAGSDVDLATSVTLIVSSGPLVASAKPSFLPGRPKRPSRPNQEVQTTGSAEEDFAKGPMEISSPADRSRTSSDRPPSLPD